jgi:hypothetical protein
MPEKGWRVLTVRVGTYHIIARRAKAQGKTIDEWLTVNLSLGEGVSREERPGTHGKKPVRAKGIEHERPGMSLEEAVDLVGERRKRKTQTA